MEIPSILLILSNAVAFFVSSRLRGENWFVVLNKSE